MKNAIRKVNEVMKIATGRCLSAKQMAEAPLNTSKGRTIFINSADGNKEDTIIKTAEGTFSREQVSYQWMVTDDISYGSEIKHAGFYPVKTVQSEYDSQGRLTERRISYGGIANPDDTPPSHQVFNPAGRWLGKRATRRSQLEQIATS